LGAVSATQALARVRGKAAKTAQAVAAAAAILRTAAQPLLAGLATDIAGARALMRLAERCGAVTDHMNFGAKMRNVLTTQDRGWITTTFAEVKNRADVLLIVDSDIGTRFPRFFERLVTQGDAMFVDSAARQIVYLGDLGKAAACRQALGARKLDVIACANERVSEVLGVLRMLVVGHPALATLRIEQVGGVPFSKLQRLGERLRAAKYGVAAWAAADFEFAHAELTVQRIVELVKDLNKTTRFAGLPLGGSDGDLTMNQVHVWQSGFALRSDFGRGYADYDPYQNGAAQLLARGEADALMWISSFNETRLPPATDVPLVVLGRADMQFEREPEVFIPVGTPGVDHAGHFVRSDKVVTMRLGKLRDSALPSVAQVLNQIEAKFAERAGK
jgi:formylmethanofuran dehydrogenase subunit B